MLNKTAYAWTDRNSTTCGKWGRTLFTHYLRKTLHCSAKRSTCPNVQGLGLLFLEDMFPAAENSRSLQVTLLFLKAQSKVLPHFGWLRSISFIYRFFLFLSRAYSTAACLTHHAECCRDRRCAGSTWHKTRPAIGYSLLLLLYWLSKTSGGSLLPHFGHRRFKICTKWAAYGK